MTNSNLKEDLTELGLKFGLIFSGGSSSTQPAMRFNLWLYLILFNYLSFSPIQKTRFGITEPQGYTQEGNNLDFLRTLS
jgi:hypothetical protein